MFFHQVGDDDGGGSADSLSAMDKDDICLIDEGKCFLEGIFDPGYSIIYRNPHIGEAPPVIVFDILCDIEDMRDAKL